MFFVVKLLPQLPVCADNEKVFCYHSHSHTGVAATISKLYQRQPHLETHTTQPMCMSRQRNIRYQLFCSYFLYFQSVCCCCCRLPTYCQSPLLYSCYLVSHCHECLSKMLNCAALKDARHSNFSKATTFCLPPGRSPYTLKWKSIFEKKS